jgi:glycosyltransferase involved in cell wall biosynthesis
MSERRPKISILMPTLNAAKYLRPTVDSVIRQSFEDWEIVVMDGCSTDGTVEVFESYHHPNIRVFVRKDESIYEAIERAFQASRGENIMMLCSSDWYVDRDWLHTCAHVLDRDGQISLVWGVQASADSEGRLGPAIRVHTTFVNPHATVNIQKENWFLYWIETGMGFSDGTMCVRRNVYERCMPKYRAFSKENDLLLLFYFRFNRDGFLPYCVPRIVAAARSHPDAQGVVRMKMLEYCRVQYQHMRQRYCSDILSEKATHVFRDSFGNPIGTLVLSDSIRTLLSSSASTHEPAGFRVASLTALGQYYPPLP